MRRAPGGACDAARLKIALVTLSHSTRLPLSASARRSRFSGRDEQENQWKPRPLERKLVAILAADVASYSRMMEIDEEGTLATLAAFRSVTDRSDLPPEGRICGTAGDSILAAFGSALAAVQSAVDIQNELAHANDDLEEDRRIQFRIGANVRRDPEADDVLARRHLAARLEGPADAGGVGISHGVHDHVHATSAVRIRGPRRAQRQDHHAAQPRAIPATTR